jgi:hypothetical protein
MFHTHNISKMMLESASCSYQTYAISNSHEQFDNILILHIENIPFHEIECFNKL